MCEYNVSIRVVSYQNHIIYWVIFTTSVLRPSGLMATLHCASSLDALLLLHLETLDWYASRDLDQDIL